MSAEITDLEVVAEERPHAERSASQLPKLALCAGYVPARGTKRTHWVTEQGLRGHSALETDSHDDLDTDKEHEMVELCEFYVNRLREEAMTERTAVTTLKEIRVNTIEGRWGYMDALLLSGSHADLVDWKFVRKAEPVDAEINLQGKDYVVGVFEDPRFPEVQTIKVHFVAPRFGSVTTAVFKRSDLPTLKLEILSILARAKATDRGRAAIARFTPEYDTCRYCARLGTTCPATAVIALKVAESYTATKIPFVPANVHSSECNDLKQLGAMVMIADVLEEWAKSVKSHASQMAKYDGLIPEGYELAYRKGQRKVTNPVALIATATHFGVSVDDILASSKVSIPALEKLVGAKAPRGFKAIKKQEFVNALRDADAFERIEDTPFLQKVAAAPALPAPSEQPAIE